MSYNLFLDDERMPKDVTWCAIGLGPWVIVRSYEEFRDYIKKNGPPSHVSFDHDLAPEHYTAMVLGVDNYGPIKTGFGCAKWLVYHCSGRYKFPTYTLHSLNPVGRENIDAFIKSAFKQGFLP